VPINWLDAGRVAAVGFAGVFAILIVLAISLGITGAIARRYVPKAPPKKEKS
jgi:Na+-transporting methylmalonyl-CoA/oxaloacetate decarboxylase gamma subunit